MKKFTAGATAVAVFLFVIVTFIAGVKFQPDASDQVNAGCAKHGGVRSWGGSDAYDATCADGFAFEGIDHNTWDWPY